MTNPVLSTEEGEVSDTVETHRAHLIVPVEYFM
jgi:hypothetical protein